MRGGVSGLSNGVRRGSVGGQRGQAVAGRSELETGALDVFARTQIAESEIAVRLVLAVVFGAVIGIERELRERAAGLRTHMLTALAAALFTVVTFEIYFAMQAGNGAGNGAGNLDPLRIMEAVTAGVSFLAAGVIIRGKGGVHGLTTGAGIWLAGALGVASGAGLYTVAGIAVALSVVILVLLRLAEKHLLDTK